MPLHHPPPRVRRHFEQKMGVGVVIRWNDQKGCWQIWSRLSDDEVRLKNVDPRGLVRDRGGFLFPGPHLPELRNPVLTMGDVDWIRTQYEPSNEEAERRKMLTWRREQEQIAIEKRRKTTEEGLEYAGKLFDWAFTRANQWVPTADKKTQQEQRKVLAAYEAATENYIQTGEMELPEPEPELPAKKGNVTVALDEL